MSWRDHERTYSHEVYPDRLKRTELQRKTPLRQTSSLNQRSPLVKDQASSFNKRRPISPASEAQRAKTRNAPSIVSGEYGCDPAHLWPRGMGGCSDALCVVPLTRIEHVSFDAGALDILPYVIAHGLWEELAHMVEAHHVDPIALLHRLTGDRYVPERRLVA